MTEKNINLLFAGTSDYIKYASVTVMSALKNLPEEWGINVFYLYADTIKPIEEDERNRIFEQARYTFKGERVKFEFIDVTDKIQIFENLNVGMWGKEASMTHYMYHLAQNILPDVDKIIRLDCDMVVNCDLSELYNIDMGDKLIALALPSGFELDETMSNGGISVINLQQWRKENTLKDLIEFGEKLPPSDFCDQYLLHEYFKKAHSDRLMLFEKEYNLFPANALEKQLEEIKIFHYAGKNPKPWDDMKSEGRGSFLWWKYARCTNFYETFVGEYIEKQCKKTEEISYWFTVHQIDSLKNKIHRSSLKYKLFEKPYNILRQVFIAVKLALKDSAKSE